MFPILTTLVVAILSSSLIKETSAATTVNFVVPDEPGTSIIRAGETLRIIPGAANFNDATTYVLIDAVSSVVVVEPSTTIVEVAFPTTFTATYVGDASGATIEWGADESHSALGAVETCGFGTNGIGTCAETLPVDVFPEETIVIEYTGSVVAYAVPSAPSSASRTSTGIELRMALAVGILLLICTSI
ncbi:hypothetical protein FB45DRAFT_214469 [Roridomyces roridus]|uniref:Uncharacterized protein n=1 Tax=Roridomyces roridus TaxID=1738132 RepID=A0AAD7BD66_9AGAR|nr:hypothetical protein FB45DRAFT_214469 [Roridomyces roridus]